MSTLIKLVFLSALFAAGMAKKTKYPIIYQDATDADNFIALADYLLNHKMLDECFALAQANKDIPEEVKLHFVLIGRPGLLGVPLHTRQQIEDMWVSNLEERFSPDILVSKLRDRNVDNVTKTCYKDDLLFLVVKANKDWETGVKYEWPLGKKAGGTTFKKAVEEDSKMIQEANGLKYMLLIQKLTGKPMDHVKKCVEMYDGGIPSFEVANLHTM
ncbi:hypothetical protein Ddc_24915 [Ditylenchus destructor]|nr:hypothetical protein Ddc_24915 [Ditylenchus destructor]